MPGASDCRDDGSFTRQTTFLLLSNVLRNLGLLALLILVARYTSPTVVGRYSLSLAVTAPIFMLGEFGLRIVFLTFNEHHRYSWYALIRLAADLAASAFSCAVAAMFDPTLLATVLVLSAVKTADSMSDIFAAPLQMYRRSDLIFVGYLAQALLGSAVAWCILATTHDLNLALVGLAIVSTFVVSTLMLVPALRLAHAHEARHPAFPRFTDSLRSIVRVGLPTGTSWALLSLVSTLPQYVLSFLSDTPSAGRFAILLYVVASVELLMNALVQSWIPRGKSMLLESPDSKSFVRAVLRTALRWTARFIPLSLVGAPVMWFALPAVFGHAYALTMFEAVPIFLCVLALPPVYFGATAMSVQNRYGHGLTLGAVAVAMCLGACLLLVPLYGVTGALWAIFAAFIARAVVSMIVVANHR
ncbi:MAG TPA: hypothetical protein VFU07_02870 [Candidatus Lumbricidophila sp.]|nr:hypothetical protein [Candidatus Lumbricidophila sp.]